MSEKHVSRSDGGELNDDLPVRKVVDGNVIHARLLRESNTRTDRPSSEQLPEAVLAGVWSCVVGARVVIPVDT